MADKETLASSLATQKELVRSLKADKADKTIIKEAVDRLLILKVLEEQPQQQQQQEQQQQITPWDVKGAENAEGVIEAVDYDKLIRDFGSTPLSNSLVERLESLTNMPAHPLIRRGIFFSHRQFDHILNLYEQKKPFYLYTGRGPSSTAMHLGHLVPFLVCKYLQDAFQCPIVIQITDDEKYLWKDLKLEDCHRFGRENTRDIIACGFKEDKTFIFSDLDYIGHLYPTILSISKRITGNQSRNTFGFDDSTCVGKIAFPPVQAAPSFSVSFPHIFGGKKDIPCLIPCAIDQDPYFRMTRDVAPKLGYKKPALIHSKFFPALQGSGTKMSASVDTSAIYLTDTPNQIKKKINKYALSGGGDTADDQRLYGANLEQDVAFQYLKFFLEDDAKLKSIEERYGPGPLPDGVVRLQTGEVKAELIATLVELTKGHQEARALVTDEDVDRYMSVRPMYMMANREAATSE